MSQLKHLEGRAMVNDMDDILDKIDCNAPITIEIRGTPAQIQSIIDMIKSHGEDVEVVPINHYLPDAGNMV